MEYDSDFFNDLEADIEISKFRLDEEWVKQPQLYLKYAMASAYFQKQTSEKEQKAKVLHATLKADAAENPEECLGVGVKVTADRCEAYATQHRDYRRAKQEAINAKYEADMALSAVFAMQQRKEALESLVRLQGMEIYSEPRTKDVNFTERATQNSVRESLKNRSTQRDGSRRRN